jgi:hypothetical protein
LECKAGWDLEKVTTLSLAKDLKNVIINFEFNINDIEAQNQKFNKKTFLAESKQFVDGWMSTWYSPWSGPTTGGRRDEIQLGAIESVGLIKQRVAYENMINYFATTLYLFRETEEAATVLKAIRSCMRSISPEVVATAIDHIFLEVFALNGAVGDLSVTDMINAQRIKFKKSLNFGSTQSQNPT